MSLSVEDKVVHVQHKVLLLREQEVEILECLRQNKRVHSVRRVGEGAEGRTEREGEIENEKERVL